MPRDGKQSAPARWPKALREAKRPAHRPKGPLCARRKKNRIRFFFLLAHNGPFGLCAGLFASHRAFGQRAGADCFPSRGMTPDPLGYDLPLPLRARYYPMGFPLDLATNSEDIIEAAAWLWERFPSSGDSSQLPAATMRILVEDHDAGAPLTASIPRGLNHLVSMVHGPDNFAVCDLAGSFTFACLTRDVARNASYVRYHFLEPAGCMMIDARYLSPLHASCTALD